MRRGASTSSTSPDRSTSRWVTARRRRLGPGSILLAEDTTGQRAQEPGGRRANRERVCSFHSNEGGPPSTRRKSCDGLFWVYLALLVPSAFAAACSVRADCDEYRTRRDSRQGVGARSAKRLRITRPIRRRRAISRYRPGPGKHGAVILIHEWDGLGFARAPGRRCVRGGRLCGAGGGSVLRPHGFESRAEHGAGQRDPRKSANRSSRTSTPR